MKFRTKLAFMSFLVGGIILLPTVFFLTQELEKREIHQSLSQMKVIALDQGALINNIFINESAVTKTLAHSPLLIKALLESNKTFSSLSKHSRDAKILALNKKWKSIKEETDPFIQQYLKSSSADILHAHQLNFPRTYGELFVTNKYGALLASTGQLTTLAHAHKYWWVAAYNKGNGRVFFDDRGFDKSVNGYVLGVVVPIYNNGEFIGIIKSNILLEPFLKKIILTQSNHHTQMRIARTGGLVVMDETHQPLTTRMDNPLKEKIIHRGSGAFYDRDKELLFAYTPIPLTLSNENYGFGGKYESIDQLLGNNGEAWVAIISNNLEHALHNYYQYQERIVIGIVILLFTVAFIVLYLTKLLTKPLDTLIQAIERLGSGDLDISIEVKTDDEIGQVSRVFNQTIAQLKETTTSLDVLSKEISKREKVETLLKEQYQYLQSIIDGIHDPIMVINTDYHVELLNKAAKQYIPNQNKFTDENPTCYEISHNRTTPCEGEDHPCPIKVVMQTKKHYSVIHNHRDPNNNKIHVELSASPLFDKNQHFIGIIEASRNITPLIEIQST